MPAEKQDPPVVTNPKAKELIDALAKKKKEQEEAQKKAAEAAKKAQQDKVNDLTNRMNAVERQIIGVDPDTKKGIENQIKTNRDLLKKPELTADDFKIAEAAVLRLEQELEDLRKKADEKQEERLGRGPGPAPGTGGSPSGPPAAGSTTPEWVKWAAPIAVAIVLSGLLVWVLGSRLGWFGSSKLTPTGIQSNQSDQELEPFESLVERYRNRKEKK
jgi:hypothetical protein